MANENNIGATLVAKDAVTKGDQTFEWNGTLLDENIFARGHEPVDEPAAYISASIDPDYSNNPTSETNRQRTVYLEETDYEDVGDDGFAIKHLVLLSFDQLERIYLQAKAHIDDPDLGLGRTYKEAKAAWEAKNGK